MIRGPELVRKAMRQCTWWSEPEPADVVRSLRMVLSSRHTVWAVKTPSPIGCASEEQRSSCS